MRLKIDFTLDGNTVLPYHYRQGIHAFIHSALDLEDSKILHDFGNGEIKPFVFSNIIGKYKANPDGVAFIGNCSLYIASCDIFLLNELFNFCVENKHLSIMGNYIPIDSIQPVSYLNKDGAITYKTISPVTLYDVVEDKKYIYYSPSDKLFKEKIKNNIAHKYETVYGQEFNEYFNLYKIENISKQVIEFKYFKYEAYNFIITIDCKKQIHDLVMDMGLGYRNPIGLGMLEYTK